MLLLLQKRNPQKEHIRPIRIRPFFRIGGAGKKGKKIAAIAKREDTIFYYVRGSLERFENLERSERGNDAF